MNTARKAIYRKRTSAVLIGIQIAVTLAILSNALALIVERVSFIARSTGIDEANTFKVNATSVDQPRGLAALQAADLNALRSISGVIDVYATNSIPLEGGGWSMDVSLTRDQKSPSAHASYYFGDEHALNTLGVKLISGRNFSASEIVDRSEGSIPAVSGIIVTKSLALQLFPKGDALGKSIYVESNSPIPIVGIVDRLQGPFVAGSGYTSSFVENTILAPYRPISEDNSYLVRVKPGSLNEVMKFAQSKLSEINGARLVREKSMAQVRSDAYRSSRSLALLLALIATVLVAVTAFGMVGLTSYWVAERRRQIGIRRALGASQLAILRQFQKENAVISASGALIGACAAVGVNLWLVSHFEMTRLDYKYLIFTVILMLLVGQIAVFWPAKRAMQVPPALAVRGLGVR